MSHSEKLGKRVLYISHGHPDLNKGGAEIAAYNMFKEMESRGEDVYFLARTAQVPHGGAAFSSRNSAREILFHTTHDDWFLFSNLKTRHMWQEFRDLLLLMKPEVVHLHHYFLLGIEIIEEIRRIMPECKIVVTLHEYLAICPNKGLMVKTNGNLCYKASARDCHTCLPDKQPGDYFLREKYIKRIFNSVDSFVSPSHFLKQRYVEWGLSEQLVTVIENGQKAKAKQEISVSITEDNSVVRFAYFGQVNPFKGIDIILEAAILLDKEFRGKFIVDIHGANLEHQQGDFKTKIQSLLKRAKHSSRFYGAYENHEMPAMLSNSDWVVIPSVWWENSPVVIQEALNYNVPLIVSDIGGMAEKVTHDFNGLHFRAGKSHELAETMKYVICHPEKRAQLKSNILPPLSIEGCVDAHFKLYA